MTKLFRRTYSTNRFSGLARVGYCDGHLLLRQQVVYPEWRCLKPSQLSRCIHTTYLLTYLYRDGR